MFPVPEEFQVGEALDLRQVSVDSLRPESTRTVVVVDSAIAGMDRLQPLLDGVAVIESDPGEPTVDGVRKVIDGARVYRPELVIAIGGGSAIDTGKMAAALIGSDADVTDHLLAVRPLERRVAVVAVPTTAGSGAEATRTCVVSDAGRKTWMWDPALAVDSVIVDPHLTVGLPPIPTVASGLDAFVHAVEAFTNRNHDELADRAALAAIAAIAPALPRVVEAPEDLEARRAMMLAAASAGVAIDRCGTAMAHCVGHGIATLSPIPHGLAVALGLRATIEWSMASAGSRFGAVAAAMGVSPAHVVEQVDELLDQVGFAGLSRPYRSMPIDPAALEAEMTSEQNLPMGLANARRPETSEWAEIAGSVAALWSAG